MLRMRTWGRSAALMVMGPRRIGKMVTAAIMLLYFEQHGVVSCRWCK